eukprot:2098050-Prymnesium_polylepis.1
MLLRLRLRLSERKAEPTRRPRAFLSAERSRSSSYSLRGLSDRPLGAWRRRRARRAGEGGHGGRLERGEGRATRTVHSDYLTVLASTRTSCQRFVPRPEQ